MPTTSPTGLIAGDETMLPTPAAVLWDMDGTLVDTEPYWLAAETVLAQAHGATWSYEQSLDLVGRQLHTSAAMLREATGIPGSDGEIAEALVGGVREEILRHGAPWQPGAHELLMQLRGAGITCALVTMSYAELAQAVLDTLPPGTFTTVVTGDEVDRGKPDPEAYLTAASRLGVAISECVALEDSPVGITAAQSSGAATIAVPHLLDIEPECGRHVLTSLRGVGVSDLGTVLAEHRAATTASG